MTEKIYRTKEIKVRLTDEEHDQLLKKMTGGQLGVTPEFGENSTIRNFVE